MKIRLLVVLLLSASTLVFAQEKDSKPQQFYKLQVRVDQSEGSKVVKSQDVSTIVQLGQNFSHIRSGERVPYGGGSQYQDVGLNVDCTNVDQVATGLAISLKLEISAAIGGQPGSLPILRQYSWQSNALVPANKLSTIYSDTDSSSQYKLDVKISMTPMNLP